MSVRVMTWVFDHSTMKQGERLVALALADAADDHGRCWPSIKTLARKALVSESTVKRATRAMVAAGELTIIDRGQHSNFYRFACGLKLTPQDEVTPQLVRSSGAVVGSDPPDCEVMGDLQNRKEPSKNRKRENGLSVAFEKFWTLYPKKRHKPAAVRAWAKNGCEAIAAEVCAGVERWLASENWTDGFIEDASTFLNQRQWEDAVPPPRNGHDRDYDHNREAVRQWVEQKRREDARQGRTDG